MKNPIIVAIDTADVVQALKLAETLAPHIGMIKLGLEFFCANGPEGVNKVTGNGEISFFLDLKHHDIPNTVAGAVRSCLNLKPALLTLHSLGGKTMMEAAHKEVEKAKAKTQLLAVTILTSHNAEDIKAIGLDGPPETEVLRLARLAEESGIDGLVCSSHEVARLKLSLGNKMKLVVPGIRPEGADKGDQSRVMTPKEAMKAGADYLVIGRPVTQANDPAQAAKDILASL